MRAACVQMCSGIDIDANLDAAEGLIRRAADEGATFIATPEMTHILQRSAKDLFAAIRPEKKDKGVAFFSSLAASLGIDLLIGSLAIQIGEGRAANRSFLFGPNGAVKARYDKIHLFDVTVSESETWKESRVYGAGKKAVIAPVQEGVVGLSICYDLRFASLYRALSQAGAQILAVPAAFTRPTGEAHWETLLRARAIETGAYVMAPAQAGLHADGRETWGHSLIIDPWGKVIASLEGHEPGVLVADLDLELVSTARAKIPAWQHNPEFSL